MLRERLSRRLTRCMTPMGSSCALCSEWTPTFRVRPARSACDHAGTRLRLGREAVADRDARAIERLLHQR